MHHFKRVLPVIVVIALGLCSPNQASAQEPMPAPRVEVPVGSTLPLQMGAKQFIKSARSENPTIATVTIKVDDPRTALVKGEKAGFTRISLTDNDGRTETFDAIVGKTSDQLRQEFLALTRKAVPTAIVDVIPSGLTAIVTGTVGSADSIQVIMEIARGLFGGVIINSMRIGGIQQIQLDVIVAAVDRTEVRNMGFNFIEGGNNHFLNSALNTGNTPGAINLGASTLAQAFLTGGSNLTSVPSTAFGIVNSKQGFVGFLNALRNENLVKILAKPTVMTLSGRPAYIVDGGESPIISSSIAGSNVNYKNFGTVVTFLPVVLGNGKIHLEVQPEISTLNTALSVTIAGTSPVSAPGFNTRKARVAVMMEDGQTLAIGGLIQNKVVASHTKVPVLGDLPFIGTAFRSVSYNEDEEELLILVTPHVVDPMACNQVPKYLPGQETRTPDDFELFLEGIMEAPRGQRTVSLRPHEYVPAYRNVSVPGAAPPADFVPEGGYGVSGGDAVEPAPAPSVLPETSRAPRLIQPMAVPVQDVQGDPSVEAETINAGPALLEGPQ